MHHDRGLVERSDTSSAIGAALPTFKRAELDGSCLLGEKPSRDRYRIDEMEIPSSMAQQIGLDSIALELAELEKRRVDLEARDDELRALLLRPSGPAVGRKDLAFC